MFLVSLRLKRWVQLCWNTQLPYPKCKGDCLFRKTAVLVQVSTQVLVQVICIIKSEVQTVLSAYNDSHTHV